MAASTEQDRAPSAAAEEMLRRCAPRVERLARRLLGQDAKDGLQEVFAAACRALPGFRRQAQLTTWFHRLAVRVLCRFRQRRDRRAGREAADEQVEHRLSAAVLRRHADSPFERAAAAERQGRVRAAVQALTPALREVLLLRLEDLSYAELAEALQIPIGTVKSRMAAAMVQLATRLQPEQDP